MKHKKPKPIETPVVIPAPAVQEPITIDKIVDKEFQEYKNFAFNKNMMVVAIGLIMATAFQKTVTSISDHLIMPIVNYLVGKTGEDWRKWVIHPVSDMNIEIGHFLGAFVDFVILTLVLYFIYQFLLKRFWPDLTINPVPASPAPTSAPKVEIIQLKKDETGQWKVM